MSFIESIQQSCNTLDTISPSSSSSFSHSSTLRLFLDLYYKSLPSLSVSEPAVLSKEKPPYITPSSKWANAGASANAVLSSHPPLRERMKRFPALTPGYNSERPMGFTIIPMIFDCLLLCNA